MSRQPISVVVTAGGTPGELSTTLEQLKGALKHRDEVVLTLPEHRGDLARTAAAIPWVKTTRDGRADGMAKTTHSLVLFLDGDMLLPGHWLDPVLAVFDDPDVVAAGPRCLRSYGPQRAEFPADATETPQHVRAHLRQWRERHRDQTADVDRLGPVVAVVRREALAAAGGPDTDLPYERLRDLGRIVLVDGAMVAHLGSRHCGLRPAPEDDAHLISASLIVKDEAKAIADCIAAVRPFADEVVVYDTGSTDGTQRIARDSGARVVQGHWTEHFGDARNRALAHCRGRWILWVDADEIAEGDPARLRQRLASPTHPAYRLRQVNEYANGVQAVVFPRLFLAADHRLAGRLHEQVVDRITGDPAAGPEIDDLWLRHFGYQLGTFTTKDKSDRNLRLAKRAVEDRVHSVDALVNLARAEYSAGNLDAAISACLRGLAEHSRRPARINLLCTLIRAATAAERIDTADTALAELRSLAREKVTVDHMEVLVRYAARDDERVVELARDFPEQARDDGAVLVGRDQLASYEIHSLMRLGRHREAADRLREALRKGQLPMPVVGMADTLRQAGSDVAELADHVPATNVRALLHEMGQAPVALAEPLADALWRRFEDDRAVLAYAAWLGPRMPLLRALEWSSRLRRAGHPEQCPLLALARDTERSPRDRTLAAAMAHETFHDVAAMPLLGAALDLIAPDDESAVLDELRLLAPGIAAAVEPAR